MLAERVFVAIGVTWHRRAACLGLSDLMLIAPGAPERDTASAREVCSGCPVLRECRDEGDELDGRGWDEVGVRAGETLAERRRRRARAAA